MNRKIGVLGVGTVGGAIADGLSMLDYNVNRYDPDKGYEDDIDGVDILFVCVYDHKQLWSIVKGCHDKARIVVIKTTCPPGTTQGLISGFGDNIVFSPEFLCEATAQEDFLHPDKIVIGTENQDVADYLIEMFLQFNARILVMHPTEAEYLKVAINAFYTMKVEFANELYDRCRDLGLDYEHIRQGMEDDRFIAAQHLDVHHGNYRGAGGKCLPKDIRLYCMAAGEPFPALAGTAMRLNDIRLSYHV